jgi:hypothetical protein
MGLNLALISFLGKGVIFYGDFRNILNPTPSLEN